MLSGKSGHAEPQRSLQWPRFATQFRSRPRREEERACRHAHDEQRRIRPKGQARRGQLKRFLGLREPKKVHRHRWEHRRRQTELTHFSLQEVRADALLRAERSEPVPEGLLQRHAAVAYRSQLFFSPTSFGSTASSSGSPAPRCKTGRSTRRRDLRQEPPPPALHRQARLALLGSLPDDRRPLQPPDLMIYLKAPVRTLKQRIACRPRDGARDSDRVPDPA